MNLRTASAFLALLLAASGCVSSNRPPNDARPGDVNFTWSLAGRTCAENTHIREIRITIPGERLENGGIYSCAPNGIMGVRLHDFRGGAYTYTLQALDEVGRPAFTRSGSFVVNGDVNVHVDLQGQEALVDFYWHFPGSTPRDPSCFEAGVQFVQVRINGAPVEALVNGRVERIRINGVLEPVVPCSLGQTPDGFRVALPSAGVHTLELYAMDDSGYTYYRYLGSVTSFAGQVAEASYDLGWGVGFAAVDWSLFPASVERTCQQAGVKEVSVQLEDEAGFLVYGDAIESGVFLDCEHYGWFNDFLTEGTYWVYVAGYDAAGHLTYLSNEKNPPSITVVAGEFRELDHNTVDVAVTPY